MRRPRRKHSDEFKAQVVAALAARGNESRSSVCRKFDISESNARNWEVDAEIAKSRGAKPAAQEDSAFEVSEFAQRMKTLLGTRDAPDAQPPADADAPPKRGPGRPRKTPAPTQAVLPWNGGAPRPVTVSYAEPDSAPVESDPRMVEYLRRNTEKALRERDALAVVLGMVLEDPSLFGQRR